MGLFRKKKNTEAPSSVLSESEIQKKLYGEFYDRSTHVLIGDRDHFREPAATPFVPKETPPEKEVPFDLFSVQKDALAESDTSPHRGSLLHVVCVLTNQAVAAIEKDRLLRENDFYGTRLVVHHLEDHGTLPFASYFANVVVVSGAAAGIPLAELIKFRLPLEPKA